MKKLERRRETELGSVLAIVLRPDGIRMMPYSYRNGIRIETPSLMHAGIYLADDGGRLLYKQRDLYIIPRHFRRGDHSDT